MRHGKRHLPKAVSTVLGLAAPALAAMLLTSTTPGLAAVPAAPAETEVALHVPTFVTPPAPAATHAAVKPAVKKAVVKAAPTARRTSSTPVRTVRRTTTTTTKSTTTTTTTKTVSQTSQPWGVDDYPYRNQSDYYAIDKWGFTERQCVSFAAWRLAQHGHAISNTRDKRRG